MGMIASHQQAAQPATGISMCLTSFQSLLATRPAFLLQCEKAAVTSPRECSPVRPFRITISAGGNSISTTKNCASNKEGDMRANTRPEPASFAPVESAFERRARHDQQRRRQVRAGGLSIDEYLRIYVGVHDDYLDQVRPRFEREIFRQ
jgi:hypothetical protein